jgi:putative MFS transporter
VSLSTIAAAPIRVDYDDAPFRAFHVRVAVASAGSEFADAFGLGIIGISLTGAAPQLGLSPVWMGLLAAASLAGLFAGALLTGPVADRLGRRPVFAYNMALLGVLSLLQGLVDSSNQLLVLRVAIGFVLGTDYAVNKAVLIEFIPRSVRGKLLGSMAIFWAAGYSSAYFVGFAMAGMSERSWRWMLIASAVPCLLVFPLRLLTPESPVWLTNQGRGDEAARIVRDKLGPLVAPPARTSQASATISRWRQLFSPAWRSRTLLACAFFTCMVIPYFAMGTFIAEVMSAINLDSAYVGGLIYNFALLSGAVSGVIVVDRLSRRAFVIGSFLISAGAMLALTVWTDIPAAPMMILFGVFAGVLSASSNLVYVYLPELFPTDLRASGIGLSSAASRIGSAISTFLLPIVVASYGIRTALGACCAVLLAGAALCLRWAPETRHLRLEALDQGADESDLATPGDSSADVLS